MYTSLGLSVKRSTHVNNVLVMVNNTTIYMCKVVIINFLLMYRVHSRDHSPASIASLLSLPYFLLGMNTTLDDITTYSASLLQRPNQGL